MQEIPRRTLSELAFIYDRDPDRRDVYVEGLFDASIIQWFTRASGIPSVAVYPIESIDIPDGELISAGLKTNNRERVVYLAEAIAESEARRAACVIDADFSRFRKESPVDPPLFQTDYACMEMYFFGAENLTKFLSLAYCKTEWPVPDILKYLATVLQEFFLYRCANDELGWGMDWLDKMVCMKLDDWQIVLDTKQYVSRFLNKNSRMRQMDEFVAHVTMLRKSLLDDPRQQMHGHDFTALLAWYVRKCGVTGATSKRENVVACMTLTLDHEVLQTENLFKALTAHLT